MSSINQIVQDALQRASRGRTSGEKVASASDIIKQASDVASALEYVATTVVDDGTATGAAQRRLVDDFFKDAAKGGPAESEAPTGTQADAPAAGARKILPFGLAKGDSPAESEAPTGTQATIGQPPGEKKAGRLTLLETLTGKVAGAASPVQSEALQDTAQPTTANENSNVARILDSNEGPVNATKRDAKMPTRARLKALFASASDTSPSSAAAKAAFPNAYAKGGMKVAEAEGDDPGFMEGRRMYNRATRMGDSGVKTLIAHPDLIKERLKRGLTHGAVGAGVGALGGGAIGGLAHGRQGAITGALGGAFLGGLTGDSHGVTSADRDFLASRGLKPGLFRASVTDKDKAEQYRDRAQQKKASIADYATIFDKAAAGELGEEAKAFAEYIEQVQV